MYPKSFLALNNAGRLTGARTALRSPDEQYTCQHCGSILVLHVDAERRGLRIPMLHSLSEARKVALTFTLRLMKIQLIRKLRRYVPNAKPVVSHADQCTSEYDAYGDEEVICS